MTIPQDLHVFASAEYEHCRDVLSNLRTVIADNLTSRSSDIESLIKRISPQEEALQSLGNALSLDGVLEKASEKLTWNIRETLTSFQRAFGDIDSACKAAWKTTGKQHVLFSQSKYSLNSYAGIRGLRAQFGQAAAELSLILATMAQSDEVRSQQQVTNAIKHELGYLKSTSVSGIAQCFEVVYEKHESEANAEADTRTAQRDTEATNPANTDSNAQKDDSCSEKTIVQMQDTLAVKESPDAHTPPKEVASSLLDEKACLKATASEVQPSVAQDDRVENSSPPQAPPYTLGVHPEPSVCVGKGCEAYTGFHNPFGRKRWSWRRSPRQSFPTHQFRTEDLVADMNWLNESAHLSLEKFLQSKGGDLVHLEPMYRRKWSVTRWVTQQPMKRMIILVEPRSYVQLNRDCFCEAGKCCKNQNANSQGDRCSPVRDTTEQTGESDTNQQQPTQVQAESQSAGEEKKQSPNLAKDETKVGALSGLETRIVRNTIARDLIIALREHWS